MGAEHYLSDTQVIAILSSVVVFLTSAVIGVVVYFYGLVIREQRSQGALLQRVLEQQATVPGMVRDEMLKVERTMRADLYHLGERVTRIEATVAIERFFKEADARR